MDFGIVSYALASSSEMALAEEVGIMALNKAANAVEYTGAARQLGMINITTRRIPESEIYLQKALHVFDLFPRDTLNEDNVNFTHAFTHLDWAGYWSAVDCKQTLSHLAEANKFLEKLSAGVPPPFAMARDQMSAFCSAPAMNWPAVPNFGSVPQTP